MKLVRTLSREAGLPIGSESNVVLKLFESVGEDNAVFPPKQLVVSRAALDPENAHWLRIMSLALTSKQTLAYTALSAPKSYAGLKALCIWGCEVGDKGAEVLAELALPLLPQCCKLELMDCGLGVGACAALADSLKQRRSTHLKILRLDHNPAMGSEGVARLSEGLYFNSLLHTLSMAYCDIKADAGIFLRNMLLTRGGGLRSLNLEGNALERGGVMALSQGLQGCATLTALNLAANNFGGDGDERSVPRESDAVRYLAAGMAGAKGLRTVNIDGNLLGAIGTAILHKAASAGQLDHITELAFTPFVECNIYKALVDKIESNKPVKTNKKGKKKKKSTKKK